jgi:hypothetical protein
LGKRKDVHEPQTISKKVDSAKVDQFISDVIVEIDNDKAVGRKASISRLNNLEVNLDRKIVMYDDIMDIAEENKAKKARIENEQVCITEQMLVSAQPMNKDATAEISNPLDLSSYLQNM